ncbi:MAG: rhomboid family intramembrane serine protease [Gemmatimonadota bacterium]|nr:rhomboid family intramembrane serine protease [Gemmatimonadota bacterium]
MTPWVKRLLLANVVMYLMTRVAPGLVQGLALVPALIPFQPWTVVTYMFLHGGFGHILFNMLMLFFFGPRLEERLGSRTFIWFYLACGVGGALLSFMTPFSAIVGASGAIYGVVIGFARYWPREDIYIWGILPIQARMLAIFMVALSLFAGFTGAQDGIAHFAHLGGLLAGWVFLRNWEKRRKQRVVRRPSARPRMSGIRDADAIQSWEAIQRESLHEINREEVDYLLTKVKKMGVASLTAEQRAFLDRMAKPRP